MFENLLYLNFSTISMAIITIIFLKFNVILDKRSSGIFQITLFFILILSLTDSVYFYYWEMDGPTLLEEICANIGYILRPAIMFLIFKVMNRNRRHILLQYLPLIINTVLLLQNFITHNVFYFTDYNSMIDGHTLFHGPFGYTPHIVSLIYTVAIAISAVQYLQLSSPLEMVTIFSCITVGMIATYLESVYGMWGLIRQAMIIFVVFYILHIYMSISNRDTLTRVYNRTAFSNDVAKNYDKVYAIVSIDLNDLKKYNDMYGHAYGDEALVSVTEIFSKICPAFVKIYRTGGDEFVFLVMKKSNRTVESIVNEIRAELSKTKYRCSFGISYRNEFESFDDAFDYADMMMYKNKAAMKQGMNDSDIAERPKEVTGRM